MVTRIIWISGRRRASGNDCDTRSARGFLCYKATCAQGLSLDKRERLDARSPRVHSSSLICWLDWLLAEKVGHLVADDQHTAGAWRGRWRMRRNG